MKLNDTAGSPWQSDLDEHGWQVWPTNDLREHDLDIRRERCWCRPFWEDHVLVHNSMDGREKQGRKTCQQKGTQGISEPALPFC